MASVRICEGVYKGSVKCGKCTDSICEGVYKGRVL